MALNLSLLSGSSPSHQRRPCAVGRRSNTPPLLGLFSGCCTHQTHNSADLMPTSAAAAGGASAGRLRSMEPLGEHQRPAAAALQVPAPWHNDDSRLVLWRRHPQCARALRCVLLPLVAACFLHPALPPAWVTRRWGGASCAKTASRSKEAATLCTCILCDVLSAIGLAWRRVQRYAAGPQIVFVGATSGKQGQRMRDLGPATFQARVHQCHV
jgi:hypothetical protein